MAITLDGTTGVTAAEFDGTVDASNLTGTLPAIDGSALTGISSTPTTADVLTATAGATVGSVGTYGFLADNTNDLPTKNPGHTQAGSSLYWVSATSTGTHILNATPLSGTWMLMGGYSSISTLNDRLRAVWLRIS